MSLNEVRLTRTCLHKCIYPTDPSYGDGENYAHCCRCDKSLSVDDLVGRKKGKVRDHGRAVRNSYDVYCIDCYYHLWLDSEDSDWEDDLLG